MKTKFIQITLTGTILIAAAFVLHWNVPITVDPGNDEIVRYATAQVTYCDLRQYPSTPAALSTDLRQLALATGN